LRRECASASLYLGKFDVRVCEGKVEEVLKVEEGIRKDSVPREKFVFKSRQVVQSGDSATSSSSLSATVSSTHNPSQSRSQQSSASAAAAPLNTSASGDRIGKDVSNADDNADNDDETVIGLSNLSDQTLTRYESTPTGVDYRLKNLTNCTVYLLDSFGALRLQGLKNCTIYALTVAGPTYVEQCVNTSVRVVCRQLRIHDCVDVNFKVWTVTGPIIEDCKGMNFGKYDVNYSNEHCFDDCLTFSGLGAVREKQENAYHEVKDFKWLKNGVKSPNWNLIEVKEGEEELDVEIEVDADGKGRIAGVKVEVEADVGDGGEGGDEDSEDEL
jgi:hypothetical protein